MRTRPLTPQIIAVWLAGVLGCSAVLAQEPDWKPIFGPELAAFRNPQDGWQHVGDVALDSANPRKLTGLPGQGVWYNGIKGNARNLFTKDKFGDLEIALEFVMGKGSNSGIKFHGHYEIQIADSFGKTKLTGSDCGGVYPRAVANPRYTTIDQGIAPAVNACKPPGEWQTLHVVFRAPRFVDGKKTANAKIEKALLNGQVIHDNQELLWPTGDRWKNKEFSEGPLMIQADHGPVAFRNVRIRTPK